MKYEIRFTGQFKKDLKLAKKQGKNLDKLFDVVERLANGETLEAKYRDHDLSGGIIKAAENVILTPTGC